MPKYRLILADDHDIVRAGTKSILEKDPDFEIIAEAENGEELLEMLQKHKCDLVVMDLSMPKMDGLTALGNIHRAYPKLKVLVLTMLKDYYHFKSAMAKGAAGYLLKEETCQQLVLAIKSILKGKSFISPDVSKILAERIVRSAEETEEPCADILTRRERQVLQLLSRGLANKNIASKLKISVRTVENHRLNLTNKLGIKTTAGLVQYALAKSLD